MTLLVGAAFLCVLMPFLFYDMEMKQTEFRPQPSPVHLPPIPATYVQPGTARPELANTARTLSVNVLAQGKMDSLPATQNKPQTARSEPMDTTRTLSISVFPQGRMGNLMFQYASLCGIAAMNNMTAVIPPSLSIRHAFPHLHAKVDNIPSTWRELEIGPSLNYNSSVETLSQRGEDLLLCGYFASWKYFGNMHDFVRQEFTFDTQLVQKAQSFLLNSVPSGTPSEYTYVGIHVRRGDASLHPAYKVASVAYFSLTMSYFEKKYKDVVFVVCSDDKNWVSRSVKSQKSLVLYSQFKDAASDMCLLSQCNHTIITSGTFGWWAGWLAGGEVLYDKGFPKKGSELWKTFDKANYYPRDWIGM